ncbi:MAG TPA: acyl-CoA carboxylase subunit epsilon [Kineosporiaceae bacterium]|nr:acyl-CoA carboxylase subunit epsilon [Kineosporiaceae bacterium]
MTDPSRQPLLRVITSDATDEEVAAVLAVVLTWTGGTADGEPAATSTWSDRAARLRAVRGTFAAGPDGWRTSYWPR